MMQRFSSICDAATEALVDADITVSVPEMYGITLEVNARGAVRGWAQVLSLCGSSVNNTWQLSRAILGFPEDVNLLDAVRFAARCRTLAVAGPGSRSVMAIASESLVHCISELLERHLFTLYAFRQGLDTQPPILRGSTGRILGGVSAETAWDVLERARTVHGATASTVLGVLNADAGFTGLWKSNGDRWLQRKMNEYIVQCHELFLGVVKLMVTADPGSYSGESTMAGALWSWEKSRAAIGVIQIVAPGKHIHPDDADCHEWLKHLLFMKKAERVAAYREWQAISALLRHTTNDTNIDDFVLDDAVAKPLLPVAVNEARVVGCGDPMLNRAYIVNRDTGEHVLVLPELQKPGDWKQLVISLDSGGIGRAGGSFAKHGLHTNICMTYDKMHRVVRDCKLAAEQSQNGDVYRALLQMSFVWSLHTRPCGSGAWHWELQAALEDFLRWESPFGELFRQFAPLWAKDLGVPCETDDDLTALWDMLVDLWQTKDMAPKMMRWFSINETFHNRASAFWPLKMILKHHLQNRTPEEDTMEDPARVMQQDPRT